NWHSEALRSPDCLSHADNADLEARHRQTAHLDHFVCRLECIEDSRQSEVKDVVEGKDVNAHGKNDTKYGVLAYSENQLRNLSFSPRRYRHADTQPVCPTRGKARQGKGRRRVSHARPPTREPGDDHPAL